MPHRSSRLAGGWFSVFGDERAATAAKLRCAGAPVIHAFELFDQAHPREVPHFYLSLLGTSAEHRGRGYGLGLLAENLRRIDEAGMPAYLEASNPANVALYERHGFEMRGSFRLPGDGPEVYTMWRDAASLG